mgnify:CR=1 FL=1
MSLEEAERYLRKLVEEIREASIYGVRPQRTFKDAATKFMAENTHKRSIADDASRIKSLMKYIGDLELHLVHMGTLQSYIAARRAEGRKARTINHGLQVVRRILNLAASEWMDENGLTWLASAPKIKLLTENDKRKPYPLSWDEQTSLFKALPSHLEKMALFAVNTGCRDREVCRLQWDWEVKVPALANASIFIVPGHLVKNGEDRLVICNKIAQSVVESQRGKHPTHVFSFRGRPLSRMLSTGWRNARKAVGLAHVRVHDLKHTFGRRLRAAGVSFEDRQDLLGHRSSRITTHYSSAELSNLLEAANSVCERNGNCVVLTVLRNPSFSNCINSTDHTSVLMG